MYTFDGSDLPVWGILALAAPPMAFGLYWLIKVLVES